jgi:hypothetical protein
VGKITGPVEDQQVIATVTSLPGILLDTPETLALTAGIAARLKVRVERFDGATAPLTLQPEPALEGVKFENKSLEAGATQVELRVTAAAPGSSRTFRLRAGDFVSPPIELKMDKREEDPR